MKAQNINTNGQSQGTGYSTLNLKKLSGTPEQVRLFVKLGNIMLKEAGREACQRGYSTTDPEWVGRYALAYGDINRDGTLN